MANRADIRTMIGKIPPQAVDAEEAILGAIMIEKGAFELASEILHADCFYKEAHKKIFEAAKKLFDKSQPIDLITIFDQLKANEDLELVGGPYGVTLLTNKVASTANLEAHCRIVVQKYIQRQLIRVAADIVNEAYKETSDAFDLIESAEKGIYEITMNTLKKDFHHISVGVAASLKKVDELRRKEYALTGVPTGFPILDRVTNGWQPTDFIILAARPSVGKTAMALNLACNAAFHPDKPTGAAIFSLEMSEIQLVDRILSSETKIPLEWIKNGSLSDGKMRQLTIAAQDRIAAAPIYIDDTSALSVFELRAKCRRLKMKHNIGLVLIDYLQLMSGEQKKGNREQEISSISRQLKAMAKDLELPVIALSQLSREVEKRSGQPKLSDLRESGSLEQDADLVAFLFRPDKEDCQRDASLRNKGTLSIGKHRNGSLDEIPFYVDLSIQKWFDPNEGLEYERSLNSKLIPVKIENQFSEDLASDDTPF